MGTITAPSEDRRAGRRRRSATLLSLLAVGMPVRAQSLTVDPAIGTNATYTSNSGLTSEQSGRRRDVITDVQADVALRARTARLTLDGLIGVDLIHYLNGSQTNGVLPRGRLGLQATVVEDNLFVDAGVEATRTRADPLAAQSGGASTANTLSTVTYRVDPYFSHAFSPEWNATLRSDNTLRHSFGQGDASDLRDSRTQNNLLRIDRKPTPIGATLELSREDTRYSRLSNEALRNESGRVIGSVAVSPELIAGAIAGRERSQFTVGEVAGSRYGLALHWRPSVRTRLDAEVEHRYFGSGWDLHFTERTPLVVVDLTMRRLPSASPLSLGNVPAGGDVATLLDTLLSSRVPNPADRAVAVKDLMNRGSLPGQLTRPLEIFSNSAQLNQQAVLNLVFVGAKNTLSGSLFYLKATTLDAAAPVTPLTFDSLQRGGGLVFNRRLAPATIADLRFTWSNVEGLNRALSASSIQREYALSLNQALTPRSTITLGVRRLDLRSNISSRDVSENEAFVGAKVQY